MEERNCCKLTKLDVELLYLKAAGLHLRLSAFFDKPTQPNYLADLRHVYIAATSLLTAVIDLPHDTLLYVPRYIEQMNPDAMSRFGLDAEKIEALIKPHIDAVLPR